MKITEFFDKEKLDSELGIDKVGFNKDPSKDVKDDDEYTFDLAEDLIYFMHNNDDFYRKSFFPVLNLCRKQFDNGQTFSHRVFRPTVTKAYKMYQHEFPLRELRDELDKDMIEEICKSIHETELKNMREGMYK
jgi:hypothetical protein